MINQSGGNIDGIFQPAIDGGFLGKGAFGITIKGLAMQILINNDLLFLSI